MATKKLDEYIVKAFKDLEFTDDEIQKGCWLLERKFKNDDGTEEIKPVAWIAYHKFLERVAQKAGITFDEPKIFNLQADEIALYVNGKKGEFSAWAIGEASTGNLTKTSKNYRWAMAEKRAKEASKAEKEEVKESSKAEKEAKKSEAEESKEASKDQKEKEKNNKNDKGKDK